MHIAAYENYIKAGDPNIEVHELRNLLSDENLRVKRRIASNPNTPKDALLALSSDCDQEVRIAVGRNCATPKHIVERLVKDDSPNVRYGLAGDCFLPIELLMNLADDDNAYVADQAQRTLEGIALEEALRQAKFVYEPGEQARLGDLLVSAGLISEKELLEYLNHSRSIDLPLGHTLVRARALPRATIVISLQLQLLVRRKQIELSDAINVLKLKGQQRAPRCNYCY